LGNRAAGFGSRKPPGVVLSAPVFLVVHKRTHKVEAGDQPGETQCKAGGQLKGIGMERRDSVLRERAVLVSWR